MKPSFTDSYTVKFWLKDADGYLKQHSDIFQTIGKNRHQDAIQNICKIWKIKESDVISCTYQ